MNEKLKDSAPADKEEAPATGVPPTKDPKKVAGSIDPKAKGPFYEAVAQKTRKRNRTNW